MNRERAYPDEPAGTYPEPPLSFEDGDGRTIEIEAVEPGAGVPPSLVEMYEAFDPSQRAQGIPPTGEDRIRDWLDTLFEEGYNVIARHGDDAVGHATLVPAGDGAYELAIFVLQSYQRAGIGRQLLEALLGFGAARGVERVWLTVVRTNRAAVNLYEDVGFEPCGGEHFELEMSLRLH